MERAETGTGAVVATSSHSISRLPAFFSSISSKPFLFFTEHHLHWPSSSSASHQVAHSQLLRSSSVSDGSRKTRLLKTSCAMDERSSHEDERRMPRGSSSGRWSNQKRLLALFKNIENSISQEKARSTNQRDSNKSSKDDNDSSVVNALQQLGRAWNVQTSNKEGDRISIHKKRAAETKKEVKEPSLPDLQPSVFKVTRPPSNFTRKSPIPSPSTPRIEQNAVVESRDGEAVEDKDEPLELEKKKLTELKEIAKARGLKGYSKLKKSELLDLLSTPPEP